MSDITKTIEHSSFEGKDKVIYNIEIAYTEDDIQALDILKINELNVEFISDWFIQTMKKEIIEDMESERTECARRSGGMLCSECRD